ncbi:MAG TPA: high frequency lysogenization protein HflD [Cellvibrionaceae bacterium]
MQLNRWQEMALSLSGVINAVVLVDKIAKHGSITNAELEPCIQTLFKRQPKDTLDVYGQLSTLLTSMEILHSLLSQQRNPAHANLLRYCMGVLHLQKKLSKKPKMLADIGAKLDKAAQQVEMFGLCSENLMANLAETYTNSISTFNFRIQVVGEASHLQQPRLANQIRSLLLASIRSAMLWHQVGGKRWHFIIYRKQLTLALEDLIKAAKSEIVNY